MDEVVSYVVVTGPITGTVELTDGTVVDVTPAVVEVGSREAADEVAHQIGLRFAAEGHPHVDPEQVPGGFRYEER